MNNYIYNQMVYFTIMFDFTWSVSDCEELVGGGQKHYSTILHF